VDPQHRQLLVHERNSLWILKYLSLPFPAIVIIKEGNSV
jgi:hypothetical protein